MKIELKNIRVHVGKSEETYCYTADLIIDGQRIGAVGNDGHGGTDYFHGDRRAYDAADAWCAKNLPPFDLSAYGASEPVPASIETECDRIVGEFLDMREMRAIMRRKVLFVQGGELMTAAYENVRLLEPFHIALFRRQHPDAVVLNAMPPEQALGFYRGVEVV